MSWKASFKNNYYSFINQLFTEYEIETIKTLKESLQQGSSFRKMNAYNRRKVAMQTNNHPFGAPSPLKVAVDAFISKVDRGGWAIHESHLEPLRKADDETTLKQAVEEFLQKVDSGWGIHPNHLAPMRKALQHMAQLNVVQHHVVLTAEQLAAVRAAIENYRDLLGSPTSADRDAKGGEWADREAGLCSELLSGALSPEAKPASPRVLVVVSGGVADVVSDGDVAVEIFDWDNYNDDPEWVEGVPAEFLDLAEPLGIPCDAAERDACRQR